MLAVQTKMQHFPTNFVGIVVYAGGHAHNIHLQLQYKVNILFKNVNDLICETHNKWLQMNSIPEYKQNKYFFTHETEH